jgi:tetratricopeptide (TPR) repeat protein
VNGLRAQLRRAREAVRRNERLTAWVLLGAIGLACLALLAPPIRDRVLILAQANVARWDARWTERVERGEALVADGRHEEAAAYLEQLDGVFPARHVKHGRDVERERVLRALGEANLAIGRKRASLDALQRAVEFDERNYLNHFALAAAALELGEPEAALASFERVLAIHPGHLPTVSALIAYHFEQADYRSVAEVYEAYLDAYVLHTVAVELGNGSGRADVRADGRDHEVDVPLVAGDGSVAARGRSLSIDGAPYPTRVAGVTLIEPLRAGVLEADPIELGRPGGWSNEGADAGSDAAVRVPVGPTDVEIARAHIVLRLLKPVDTETWELITTSYLNLLERDALEAARERSVIMAAAGPGDGEESS